MKIDFELEELKIIDRALSRYIDHLKEVEKINLNYAPPVAMFGQDSFDRTYKDYQSKINQTKEIKNKIKVLMS